MPTDSHPMTLFSAAILSMQNESIFARHYQDGMQRTDYWEATLEDSLNLTAKLPGIAAYIYNLKYNSGRYIAPDFDLDWSANFAKMIGIDNREYMDLARLYFFLHADHESGNVSAHATHLVGSSLSDVYYSCAAGINGLAGPLHGLANQESLRWLLCVRDAFDGLPTKEQLVDFAWDTLNNGLVIPGYGHAVLRLPDPRFTAQFEFGKKYMPDDELFKLVQLVNEVVPGVLQELGKVKNPWPNVDAVSGALQYHYGVREQDFYTVLFGVSRILGVTSNAVWARALGQPIERPKSLTTQMLENIVTG
jgi:citrate synthase